MIMTKYVCMIFKSNFFFIYPLKSISIIKNKYV